MLVLLLTLVLQSFHFSLDALEPRANVLEARRDFFYGDTSGLVQIEEALFFTFLLSAFFLFLAEEGFPHGSSSLLRIHSLCVFC